MKVEFANNYAYKMVNDKLTELVNVKINNKNVKWFPGCQPVSIERKNFKFIKDNDYVICDKTDGVRYVLVCITYEDLKYCFVLDRNLDIYLIDICIHNDLYKGTILDGELIQEYDKSWSFYVFDTVMYAGELIKHKTHTERINYVDEFIKNTIYCKPFDVKKKSMKSINTYTVTNEYKTDGVILTPVNLPLIFGTNYNMFKWKPVEKNTIDFYIDSNILYLFSRGEFIQTTNILEKQNESFTYPGIFECEFVSYNKWNILKKREDKSHPNNLFTFNKTLLNIRENIKLEEILQLAT